MTRRVSNFRALGSLAVVALLLCAQRSFGDTGISNVFTIDLGEQATDRDLVALTRAVPIVLDVLGAGGSHYTTELTLTNRGTVPVTATLRYEASLGAGSGAVSQALAAGQQLTIPDVTAYLRGRGLPLPDAPPRGGQLLVKFMGASAEDDVAATARTATATFAPLPEGAAGLAYAGIAPSTGSTGALTVFGLRENVSDRSNLAIFNPSPDPVVVRVTVFAGDASGASAVVRGSETVPPFGWLQISRVLEGTGITSGWATVEKAAGSGTFSVYGVINDNVTSDGSYVLPTSGTFTGDRITVPVLVESSAFRSELVLANRGMTAVTLTLRYSESLTPALGVGGTRTVQLRAGEQLIVPEAIDYLRRGGVSVGNMGAASYAGALRITVAGGSLSNVFAGARTASQVPGGGQFGLFTPGVYRGQEASDEAFLYGLRADVLSRSNVAVLNAGADSDGNVTLELRAFDGDGSGVEKGSPEQVTLAPGTWRQLSGFLGARGIRNGWVKVARVSGSAPWVAYGVMNDGGNPGERTGDGAYVPMVAKATGGGGASPDEITITLPGGVPLVLVRIPAGTFTMGSPSTGSSSERPQHQVALSAFYLGKYEVTQGQWQAVMGNNPANGHLYGVGTNYPVYYVNWDQIATEAGFVSKLNEHLTRTGQAGAGRFRLPTEAEWEYAARGGTTTPYSFGDNLACDALSCTPCTLASQYMWWCGNSSGTAQPVGQKTANPYGLFDMYGNEAEWVSDWYGAYSGAAQANPQGPSTGSYRVIRGGNWEFPLDGCRSASRGWVDPSHWASNIGFRLCRSQ